jgi:spermidine synthase
LTVSGRLLGLLFFASGVSALMYEVLWIRIFTSILGGITQSGSAVVTAFMLGTAVGSYAYGKTADRTTRVLRVYGLLELGTALTAALAFGAFFVWQDSLAGLYTRVSPGTYTALLFTLAFVFVAIPAAFVGGTLPVLVRALTSSPDGIRTSLGRLYAANTLGAALGSLASVWVVARLGYLTAYAVAVGVSAVVGGVALALDRREPKREKGALAADDSRLEPRHATVILAMALSGAAALSLEVVWFRIAQLVLRGTITGFGLLIMVFLSGLALGSAAIARFGGGLRQLVRIEIAIAVCTALSLPALGFGFERATTHAGQLVVLFLPLAIATFLYGMTLPLAARLLVDRDGNVGRRTGLLYAANTSGAVVGSLATGFVLVPRLGTQTTLLIAPVLNLGCALLLSRLLERRRVLALAALCQLALMAALFRGAWTERVLAAIEPRQSPLRSWKLTRVVESELQILSVLENEQGFRLLKGGPDISGDTRWVRRQTQKLQGHLPMLIHPHPDRVLEIGYGVGEIAATMLLHDVKQMDLVEIDPRMIEVANQSFSRINRLASEDPRVRIHLTDGRLFLRATRSSYDVIMTDSMFLHSEASLRLYTREHFRAGFDKLAPEGIMIVWLPVYVGDTAARTIIRTFVEVFPESLLWQPDGLSDTEVYLIGFKQQVRLDAARITGRFEAVKADLELLGWDRPLYFLAGFRAGPGELSRIRDSTPLVNRDMRPVLDFLPSDPPRLLDELRNAPPDLVLRFVSVPGASVEELQKLQRARADDRIGREFVNAPIADLVAQPERHAEPFQRALRAYPGYAPARMHLGLLWSRVGRELERSGEDPSSAYEKALAADPGEIGSNLFFATRGDPRKRELHLERVRRLNPYARALGN